MLHIAAAISDEERQFSALRSPTDDDKDHARQLFAMLMLHQGMI